MPFAGKLWRFAAAALLVGCVAAAPREPSNTLASAHDKPRVAPAREPRVVAHADPTSPARAPGAPAEEDLEACPQGTAEPSNDSPSYIVDDFGLLYSRCLLDYLEVFGQTDQALVDPGFVNSRRAVCAALGSEGIRVFERAQSGKPFKTRAPDNCIGAEKQELRIGRMIWEFSKLPNGTYLGTRTARSGSPFGLLYQGHSISTSRDGAFVVTVVSSNGWRCPHDPSDPCELFQNEQHPDISGEVRCAGDEVTRCAPAGVTSDVYVTDSSTRATAHFGWFSRRPAPTVTIDAKQIVVTAGDCTQVAPLPLVAAPPLQRSGP